MGPERIGSRKRRGGLALLEQHAGIDVMVTDVRMPRESDGLALVSRVCCDRPLIRLVVVSGNAAPAEVYNAGAAMFMVKPYLTSTLAKAVLGLLPRN